MTVMTATIPTVRSYIYMVGFVILLYVIDRRKINLDMAEIQKHTGTPRNPKEP